MNNMARKRRRWRAWEKYILYCVKRGQRKATAGMGRYAVERLRFHNRRTRRQYEEMRAAILSMTGVDIDAPRGQQDFIVSGLSRRPPQTVRMIADPTDETTYIIENAATTGLGVQVGPTTLVNVHRRDRCAGRFCVVHNPSPHHMAGWPLNWRGDRGLMERTCPHGIGHPDPDDLAYQESIGREQGVHGCDGCCCR